MNDGMGNSVLHVIAIVTLAFFLGQYVTYDANAFIADFGGYLGLLLGQSIIAMYDMLVSYMDSATKYLHPR